MKHLLLASLFFGQVAMAACDVRSASVLANERRVGEVTDLVKTSAYGQCHVKFRINVDGNWYDAEAAWKGMENDYVLCHQAIDKAKREVLIGLGGTFQSESVTVCKTGDVAPRKIKIGDTVLENEVSKHPKATKYFTYRNSRCRMFIERNAVSGELKVYNGVICQIDNSPTDWLVVDKW